MLPVLRPQGPALIASLFPMTPGKDDTNTHLQGLVGRIKEANEIKAQSQRSIQVGILFNKHLQSTLSLPALCWFRLYLRSLVQCSLQPMRYTGSKCLHWLIIAGLTEPGKRLEEVGAWGTAGHVSPTPSLQPLDSLPGFLGC